MNPPRYQTSWSPYRHTIKLRETGAFPAEDRLHASLNVLHSLHLRFTTARPVGMAHPMVALTGATAIGIMTGEHDLMARAPELIVAHDTRARVTQYLDRNPSATLQQFAQTRDDLLARAQFLNIPVAAFNRPAHLAPRRGDGPGFAFERGTQVLLHAAMRTATVSTLRIRRAGADYAVQVPMLSADGTLLVAIARLGRFTAFATELRAMLDNALNDPATADTRARIEQRLQETSDAAEQARTAWERIAPALMRARDQLPSGVYAPVTDAILADADAHTVVQYALRDLPAHQRQTTHDALVGISMRADALTSVHDASGPTPQR